MKLWEKDGKTEFPDVGNSVWSALTETREGIPYYYGFDPTKEPEAEARISFERYMGSEQAKADVEKWKISQRRVA